MHLTKKQVAVVLAALDVMQMRLDANDLTDELINDLVTTSKTLLLTEEQCEQTS